jgi:hypothetical protein
MNTKGVNMSSICKLAISAFTFSLLAACGGGGDAVAVNTAEGIWQGPSSTGATVKVAILENGESWGAVTMGNTWVSALAGTANGKDTAFTASGSEFDFGSNTVGTGSLSGTVTQKQRIQATSSTGSTVNLAYNNDYEQAVTPAEIAGSYTLSGRTARYSVPAMTFTIGATGNFTISDSACTTTGTATPRASGKAIVNVSVTGTGNCILGNGVTLNGIAVLDKKTTPQTLMFIALNSTKTDGLVLIGQKN